MSAHTITTTEYDTGVRVNCTCGWWDRWNVKDGSAQQSAADHLYHQENQ